MADYLVGMVMSPKVSLATAVAASSAFPPVLSPCILEVNPHDFKPDPTCPLQREPFTSKIALSDGGVYDNLGLETVWKEYQTVLVSDAGGSLKPDENPKRDWILPRFPKVFCPIRDQEFNTPANAPLEVE